MLALQFLVSTLDQLAVSLRIQNRAILLHRLVHGVGDSAHQVGTLVEIGTVGQGDDVAMMTVHFGKGDALAIELAGEFGDHAHQALVVALLFETTREHADDATVKLIALGLVLVGEAKPLDAALERVEYVQVL